MATMRITKIKQTAFHVALKVEGAVASESVRVLEEECLGWLEQKKTIQLDFSGVTYIDHSGVEMLKSMAPTHMEIIHSPDFIQHVLNLQNRNE